jgi:hypothetical protein
VVFGFPTSENNFFALLKQAQYYHYCPQISQSTVMGSIGRNRFNFVVLKETW